MATLTTRLATKDDFEAVKRIDVANLYLGFDYLSNTYFDVLSAKDTVAVVGEKNGEVVGFVQGHLVDCCQTMVRGSGRVREDARGDGIMLLMHSFLVKEMRKISSFERMRAATFIAYNYWIQHLGPEKRNEKRSVMAELDLYVLFKDATFADFRRVSTLPAVIGQLRHHDVRSALKNEINQALHEGNIFPFNQIPIEVCPIDADPQNTDYIMDHTVSRKFTQKNDVITSLSLLSHYGTVNGFTLILNYFGPPDASLALAHLHSLLPDMIEVCSTRNPPFFMLFFCGKQLDANAMMDELNQAWKLKAGYKHLPCLMFELNPELNC